MFAFDIIRYVPLIAVIGYAALCDWRTKEVPNKVWLYAFIGLSFTTIETIFYLNSNLLILELLSASTAFIIAYLFFITHNWGGADAKALMTIGVSAPLFPAWAILANLPFPLNMFPFMTLFITSIIALTYLLVAKSNEPLKKRKLKFLPFMFIGLIIAVLL